MSRPGRSCGHSWTADGQGNGTGGRPWPPAPVRDDESSWIASGSWGSRTCQGTPARPRPDRRGRSRPTRPSGGGSSLPPAPSTGKLSARQDPCAPSGLALRICTLHTDVPVPLKVAGSKSPWGRRPLVRRATTRNLSGSPPGKEFMSDSTAKEPEVVTADGDKPIHVPTGQAARYLATIGRALPPDHLRRRGPVLVDADQGRPS